MNMPARAVSVSSVKDSMLPKYTAKKTPTLTGFAAARQFQVSSSRMFNAQVGAKPYIAIACPQNFKLLAFTCFDTSSASV
eukprot:1505363-Amphidinium_carterae.1